MTRATLILVAALGGLPACTVKNTPVLPPPTGPGDCTTARDNVQKLPDNCGLDMTTFYDDCKRAEAAEAGKGIRYPVACATAADSCAALDRCH